MDRSPETTESQPFRIGDYTVIPARCCLVRGEEEIKLEPKAMEVLVRLAENAGNVISRESLEKTVWAGTVVGYDAISSSIIKLRKALGDDSHHPRYIETVPKRGYRLIIPVTEIDPTQQSVSAIHTGSGSIPRGSDTPGPEAKTIFSARRVIASLLVLIVAGLALYYFNQDNPAQQQAGGSSVVVLPFGNLSDDSSQDYFSDGITDDLITDLSKVGSIRVIAPQSAYHFKNKKQFTLDEVAEQLGVQYVVQGSIQKSGERVRINVQLTNVQQGDVFWAERFDTKSESIFDIQDRITRKVIEAMALTISESETGQLSSSGTTNFAAYDTFLQGQKFIKMRSREGYEMGMSAYQKAIELDPGFARVYGAMSVALTHAYRFQWTDLPLGEAKERSLELANKALSSNPNSPQIYWALGYVHIHRKEYEAAEEAARNSIKLSPNYADGYGLLAYISNWRGKAKQAERYIKKAIDLNPYHSFDYPWNLGFSYYTQGRYTEAEASLRSALGRNANALYPRLFLTATYIRLGQDEEAAWEIDNITLNRPDTTLRHLRNLMPFENKNQLDAVLDDLRKAGLPE